MSDFQLPSITAQALVSDTLPNNILIDVRKPAARAADGKTIAGAVLRNPFEFNHDDPLLKQCGRLIFFCVHGHEVSQFATALAMVHGCSAVFVQGGYEALISAGAATTKIENADRAATRAAR